MCYVVDKLFVDCFNGVFHFFARVVIVWQCSFLVNSAWFIQPGLRF